MKGKKNQAIIIYNILRQIGLSPKSKGIKILTSAIIVALDSADEFIIVSNIYEQLSKQYKLSPNSINTAIAYTLNNLIGNDYKDNFQKIFGVEFSRDFYSNKTIIEEVSRIIQIEYAN